MNTAAVLGRRGLAALALGAILGLAGCAAPLASSLPAGAPVWSGRLSLRVESDPPQSMSAAFDLRGSAAAGELVLTTPLGGTLAQLTWAPGSASLRTPQETRTFDSVDTLLAEVTGTPLPVAALFDWLSGQPARVDGWQADLSQHAGGRVQARRNTPAPAADLRLAFERQ